MSEPTPEQVLREHLEAQYDYLGPDPNSVTGEAWGPDPEALAAFEALVAERDELSSTLQAIEDTTDYRVIKLERALARAAYVAEHLLAAVHDHRIEWTGVHHEGHSEDAYLNAKLAEEIKGWTALAESDG